MTCREVDETLIIAPGRELSSQARAHLVTCESCRRLASAIEAGGSRYKLPIDLRKRIQASIPSSIAPVRQLAPNAFWVTAFLLIFAGIGIGAAGRLGIYGWPALSLAGRILIFPLLVALAALAAFVAARQMRPGSRSLGSPILFATIFLAMETVFFLTFHDYSLGNFVRSGYRCLSLGLFTAIPAGGLVWLLVRRGYVLAPISVGCLVGLLAGLTGLFTLELHCPILTLPHLAIWHTGYWPSAQRSEQRGAGSAAGFYRDKKAGSCLPGYSSGRRNLSVLVIVHLDGVHLIVRHVICCRRVVL